MRWRCLVSLVVSVVTCLVLASCAQTTSARDTFGDEKLMTEDYPGLVEVFQGWYDGEKGGTAVKPSLAEASRRFEAASRADLEAGFEELTSVAVAEGWVEDTPGASPFRFLAFKEFPAGQGLLGIEIGAVDGAEVVMIDFSLNN